MMTVINDLPIKWKHSGVITSSQHLNHAHNIAVYCVYLTLNAHKCAHDCVVITKCCSVLTVKKNHFNENNYEIVGFGSVCYSLSVEYFAIEWNCKWRESVDKRFRNINGCVVVVGTLLTNMYVPYGTILSKISATHGSACIVLCGTLTAFGYSLESHQIFTFKVLVL